MVRFGTEAGACGAEVQTLEKVVVRNVYNTIYDTERKNKRRSTKDRVRRECSDAPTTDDVYYDATRSPAYEAVKNFQISEFDIGKMFEDWRV
jgi:hypothetical protein